MITAREEGYITSERSTQGRTMIEETQQSINGYISYLKSRKDGDWGPGDP